MGSLYHVINFRYKGFMAEKVVNPRVCTRSISRERYKKACRYDEAGMAYIDVLELQIKSKKKLKY